MVEKKYDANWSCGIFYFYYLSELKLEEEEDEEVRGVCDSDKCKVECKFIGKEGDYWLCLECDEDAL